MEESERGGLVVFVLVREGVDWNEGNAWGFGEDKERTTTSKEGIGEEGGGVHCLCQFVFMSIVNFVFESRVYSYFLDGYMLQRLQQEDLKK